MSGRIVVGVDGSPGAVQALDWAIDQALARDAELEVVHAWHYPWVGDAAGMAAAELRLAEIEAAAREVAVTAANQARDRGVPDVSAHVVHGAAAEALLEQSKGADALVVGSRGRGGFVGLLLGSISQQCVHHAVCPVVVVPTSWRPAFRR